MLAEQALARGDAVRIFDLNPPGPTLAGGRVRRAATCATATRSRAACDGVDVVFHNVAQVPLAKDRALFDVGQRRSAPRTCSSRRATRGSPRSCTRRRARCSASPSTTRSPRTSPCRPLEAYGRAKLRAELLCHDAVAAGLDVTIVRPRTILGHGRLGIIAILFEFVADGAPVFVLGGGDNRYQFVHADDLADACLRAGDRAGPSVYNIGALEFGTMRETLQALVDHAQTGSRVRSLPVAPAAAGDAARSRSLGLAPFAPYHWLLYSESLYFDVDQGAHRARLGAAALERVDGDRVVRVVPRPPRRGRRRQARTTSRRSASAPSKCCAACPERSTAPGRRPMPGAGARSLYSPNAVRSVARRRAGR